MVLCGVFAETVFSICLFAFDETISQSQQATIIAQGDDIHTLSGMTAKAKSDASAAVIDANGAKDTAQTVATKVASLKAEADALETSLTKVAAEVAKFQPRKLEPEQIRRISAKIGPFAGTPFDLSMQVELDPMNLTDKIEDALIGGGWKEQPVPSGGQLSTEAIAAQWANDQLLAFGFCIQRTNSQTP